VPVWVANGTTFLANLRWSGPHMLYYLIQWHTFKNKTKNLGTFKVSFFYLCNQNSYTCISTSCILKIYIGNLWFLIKLKCNRCLKSTGMVRTVEPLVFLLILLQYFPTKLYIVKCANHFYQYSNIFNQCLSKSKKTDFPIHLMYI